MENRKIQRINSDILRVLSITINQKMQDSTVRGVSILNVDTSADLSHCKVYVDINGDEDTRNQVFNALQAAGGFLRSEIAAHITMKQVPQLRFVLDKGRENAARVEQLLAQINQKR